LLVQWIPAISALIALLALVTNIVITTSQRLGDNRISANSVLIALSDDGKSLRLTNGGKYPVLDVQLYVENDLVGAVGEVTPLASGESRDIELESKQVNLAASYPHAIRVTFADARGKYWSRTPLGLAARLKDEGASS
jgi:hypothetical protein